MLQSTVKGQLQMLNLLKYWTVIVFTLAGLIGCSKPQNASTEYSRSQINSAQETIIATVVSKRVVTVDGDSGVGGTAGGLTGYIAGSTVGDTPGENAVGAIAGSIIGATIGSAVESKNQSVEATEYVLEAEDGKLFTILMTDSKFTVGETVYVGLGDTTKILAVAE